MVRNVAFPLKEVLLYAFFLFIGISSCYAQRDFDYYPLALGGTLGADHYKTDAGFKFRTGETQQSLFLTRTHNTAFLLAEMDFIAGWPQQTSYNTSNVDTIESNSFQLFNALVAFYRDNGKRTQIGGFFKLDGTVRNAFIEPAFPNPDNVRREIAAVGGLGLVIGVSVKQQIGDRLVVDHNFGVGALGNAQNEKNVIATNVMYLGSAIYPLSGRFSVNGYLNIDRFGFIDQQRLSTDSGGSLLNWKLRVGIGIHLGREAMLEK